MRFGLNPGLTCERRIITILTRDTEGKGMNISDISRGIGFSRLSTMKHLDLLEADGILRREEVIKGRRYVYYFATSLAFELQEHFDWTNSIVEDREEVIIAQTNAIENAFKKDDFEIMDLIHSAMKYKVWHLANKPGVQFKQVLEFDNKIVYECDYKPHEISRKADSVLSKIYERNKMGRPPKEISKKSKPGRKAFLNKT